MKAYGYILEKSLGSVVVQIINEEGALLRAFQMHSYPTALKHAYKFCPDGYDFEFIENQFKHAGLKIAQENYKEMWGVDWYGSYRESHQ